MTDEKVDAFFPMEAVKELARLRQLRDKWDEKVAEYQIALEDTDAYKVLTGVEDNLQMVENDLDRVETAFKAGCENIFEETDEKKFPGGQIKMRSTIDYDEGLAVDWAIRHNHPELLKILKAGFKNACKTLAPGFVTKGTVGTMYIDSDLSQYLEVTNAKKT